MTQLASTNCFGLKFRFELSNAKGLSPTGLLRSPFFSSMLFAGRCIRPAFTTPQELPSISGCRLWLLRGSPLNQGDANICFGLFKLAIAQGLDENGKIPLRFSAKTFLRAIGKSGGSLDRKSLQAGLERMSSTTFWLQYKPSNRRPDGVSIGFKLFDMMPCRIEKNEDGTPASNTKYELFINRRLLKVFKTGWTLLDLEQRSALKKDPLALWLHSFYSSHNKQPFPYSAKKLKGLCGRNSIRNKKWLEDLADAVAALKTSTKWPTCLLESGVLLVSKTGAPALRPQPSRANQKTPVDSIPDDEI